MKKPNSNDDEVSIVHLNPRTELNELEKTAILQFKIEEELSRTKEFALLNKTDNLSNTSKLDLSDIHKEVEMPIKKEKKSLYDTVVIALDSLVGRRKNIKNINKVKVIDSIDISVSKRQKMINPENINNKVFIIGEDNIESYLTALSIVALTNLSQLRFKARKYSSKYKNNKVDDIHINKTQFDKNKDKLNKYAIDNLYYNIAPKETRKYKIYRALVFVSSFVLILCLAYLGHWIYEGSKINDISNDLSKNVEVQKVETGEVIATEEEFEEITEEPQEVSLYWKYLNTPLSSVNFDDLIKENKDTIGWLIVNNTNIDYPVVQTNDNDFYLKHAFDKSKNNAGWVFADYRNTFSELNRNTVIYAHGRKDKVMFGSLVDTMNKNWYTNIDNQLIQFSTLEHDTMWQIFSIYKIEKESYYITTDFSSDKSYQLFLDTMKERSIYDFNVNVSSNDKILTLSTCFNDYGIRMVVQAKLVKIQKK